ncbi:MAG: hypothetical protein Q8Q05_01220 [bacterium]|nr:hypothetical protein [bacterium]
MEVPNRLIGGYAYTLNGVDGVGGQQGIVRLIRLALKEDETDCFVWRSGLNAFGGMKIPGGSLTFQFTGSRLDLNCTSPNHPEVIAKVEKSLGAVAKRTSSHQS